MGVLIYLLANKTPTDFIHDPFVQFIITVAVALIVGIGTIVVVIWIFLKQRDRKKLSYQLFYVAQDRGFLILKIWNSGNRAIRPEHYLETVKFNFDIERGVVVDCKVTEPKNLNLDEIKTSQDYIELLKFPLNPKDSIELEVSFTGYYRGSSHEGKIENGKIVKAKSYNELLSSNRRTRILLAIRSGVLTALLIGGIIWIFLHTKISTFSSCSSGWIYLEILGFKLPVWPC